MPELSAKAEIRRWIRQRLREETEIKLPELAKEAELYFLADSFFTTKLIKETLTSLIYELVQALVGETRYLVGEEVVDREGIKERARAHPVFEAWMEHANDRHIRFMEMTREQVLKAAEERERRGWHELQLGTLFRGVAAQLEEGEQVKDRFTAQEIDDMWQEMAEHS
jgi:hypothetical protein